jgi:hypothetical protein
MTLFDLLASMKAIKIVFQIVCKVIVHFDRISFAVNLGTTVMQELDSQFHATRAQSNSFKIFKDFQS